MGRPPIADKQCDCLGLVIIYARDWGNTFETIPKDKNPDTKRFFGKVSLDQFKKVVSGLQKIPNLSSVQKLIEIYNMPVVFYVSQLKALFENVNQVTIFEYNHIFKVKKLEISLTFHNELV